VVKRARNIFVAVGLGGEETDRSEGEILGRADGELRFKRPSFYTTTLMRPYGDDWMVAVSQQKVRAPPETRLPEA